MGSVSSNANKIHTTTETFQSQENYRAFLLEQMIFLSFILSLEYWLLLYDDDGSTTLPFSTTG